MNKKSKVFYVLSWIAAVGAVATWIFAEWVDHFGTTVFGRTSLHFFGDTISGLLFAIWFAMLAFYFKQK